MADFYNEFSAIYDRMGESGYSELIGEGILRYFEECYPEEELTAHLDLGCGTGVLCARMAEEGIDTAGIDSSEKMIRKAENSYPGLAFAVGDAASFHDGYRYDLVTCINDVVNHFTDQEHLRRLFAAAHRELRPGGFLIFDFIESEKLPWDEPYIAAEDGKEALEYRIVRAGACSIDIHVRYCKDGKTEWEKVNTERLYDRAAITEYLQEAGFRIVEIKEEFYDAANPFKSICIARKSDEI